MPDGYHRFALTFTGRSKLKTPTGSSVSLQIAEYSFQRHIHASNLDIISAAHPLPSTGVDAQKDLQGFSVPEIRRKEGLRISIFVLTAAGILSRLVTSRFHHR
ncbi:hypothetical protein NW756_010614 [Fusarium oxysporum]|nr:hypothetical protein NW763_003038 [Fusarium oxysporum]KAJ4067141.1 hypothetical protein NW753_002219 [Fusarium oxysporum]KAJ4080684.1 hypothetical protein NW756_010614 [Fusarium oxysporum]KAJ4097253.1 hypothetical protein NW769_011030 [Fusarium oxysporum]KAJ4222259.1 hypothetical protein NW760_010926 [Fusarium oxysporum]